MGGGGQQAVMGVALFSGQGPLAARSPLHMLGLLVGGFVLGSLVTSIVSSRDGPAAQQLLAQIAAQNHTLHRIANELAYVKSATQLGGSRGPGIPLLVPPLVQQQRTGPVYIANQLAARNVSFDGRQLTVLAMTNDEYVGGSILATGVPFEPATLKLMLDNVVPGTTVIDAGCNFGSYSVFFAAKVGLGGRVHCFEPQSKMAQLANANSLVNGLSSIMRVHNVALSFAPGAVHMAATLPDGAMAGQTMQAVETAHGSINYGGMKLGKGGESAAAIMLDTLDISNVSFMKIDVQGAEQLMLYGAQKTITRNLPVVVYEHLEGWNVTADMIESMKIPKEVLDWSIDKFFAGLGYTAQRTGIEVLQRPPPKKAGRRLL